MFIAEFTSSELTKCGPEDVAETSNSTREIAVSKLSMLIADEIWSMYRVASCSVFDQNEITKLRCATRHWPWSYNFFFVQIATLKHRLFLPQVGKYNKWKQFFSPILGDFPPIIIVHIFLSIPLCILLFDVTGHYHRFFIFQIRDRSLGRCYFSLSFGCFVRMWCVRHTRKKVDLSTLREKCTSNSCTT
jgi:hypothetical protein